MRAPERQSPPAANRGASDVITDGDSTIIPRADDHLADLDALAETLRGRFVVQTQIDGDRYRTAVYTAENAARRATARGKHCRVTLCQLMPVGVVQGLGVAL